jgi:hypothetical protein
LSNKALAVDAGQGAAQGDKLRSRNLRTGLIMASIALVGFLGVFARYWLFG